MWKISVLFRGSDKIIKSQSVEITRGKIISNNNIEHNYLSSSLKGTKL